MKVMAFITHYAALDRIIDHLSLTFVAGKPLPYHIVEQVAPMAAEESEEYFRVFVITGSGSLSSFSRFERISCPD
jgi:hypothetical protein